MEMSKRSKMRKAVQEWAASRPDQEISTGKYVGRIGYKYVTVTNTWDIQTSYKVPLEDFYIKHVDGTIYGVEGVKK
jgi:hypothetical protein